MIKIKKNVSYNTRKIHRYLGVFMGVQFLLWTLGGLYFSWNNMNDVHGETLLKQEKKYFENINFLNVQKGINNIKVQRQIDSVHSVKLIEALGKSLVQFKYFSNQKLTTQLINTETGLIKKPFSKEECLQLVIQKLKNQIAIKSVEFLNENSTNVHHEYRNKPLPAYAFTLEHPTKTTIYVATELGQITSVRNNNWRRFDFLWMLHTMDYNTRDHITNWILRIFSVLGMVTIFSGFYLYYISSPTIRRLRKKYK